MKARCYALIIALSRPLVKSGCFFVPSKKRCSVPPDVKAPHTIAVLHLFLTLV